MRSILERVIDKLKEDEYFDKFTYRKRDRSFILKTTLGKDRISLVTYNSYPEYIIEPIYLIRFDILRKWFEKYSFMTLQDQRDGYYVGFTGRMLGVKSWFEFERDGANFDEVFAQLKDCVISTSKDVFERYSTLEKAYTLQIQPILDGTKNLIDTGADWLFENLTLCRLVHPERYEELKKIHLDQAKMMNDRNEPNIRHYYDRMDEILSYMENLDLKI